ncbi:L-xylulose reductase [Mizuhopecten yessoensis]|uniref:L-xylulose reductase n=1 Tax=Mizuhopecten yessoensis TaxID=6573 RepID=A0A210QX80_MIZYE|nr:L-xylulose reductase [Mizuhopecten yessoensis]
MEIRLDNKKALVTGAGRGIGWGIVRGLVECGAEVYALSITKANLDDLKLEFPPIHTVQADLSDWEATRAAVEGVGTIDLLVNNAAVSPSPMPFVDTDKKTYEDVFSVNLMAAINVSQVAARGMLASGRGGAIVNISSVNACIAINKTSPYNIAKAGLDMMTKCMAMELSPTIRINSVNPTVCMTAMGKHHWSDPKKADPWKARHPMGRFGEVEEVVNTVLFLLSDKASYTTGTCVPVDGGLLCN